MSDLRSRGLWFDSRSRHYQVATTRVGVMVVYTVFCILCYLMFLRAKATDCFQRVLAIAILSVCLSVRYTGGSLKNAAR